MPYIVYPYIDEIKKEFINVHQGDFLGNMDHEDMIKNRGNVHLHFSISQWDGNGCWKSELDIDNTYDPSEYFGLDFSKCKFDDEFPECAEK